MFKFASRKIAFKATPYTHVVLASSYPVKQQVRFFKPRLEERTPGSSPTAVPDPALDDLFYHEEGANATQEVVVCQL